MAQQNQLTAQQRAALFAQTTRQNLQMLPSDTKQGGATTMQFTLPKARLLSKIMLNVEATVKVTHATNSSISSDKLAPYRILRRVSVDLNNGFSPFVIDGAGLALYNMIRLNPDVVEPSATKRKSLCYFPTIGVSSAGSETKFNFTVELPITLNQRDPVGLILLQNESTQVTVTADIANGSEIFGNQAGYTVEIPSITITPMVETFTLPAVQEAFPDLSVIKLVSSRTETFAGSGQNILKLNVGTIYRKVIMFLEDNDGRPMTEADITSNIDLVFNQADVPYSIRPVLLTHKNCSDLGFTLPEGCYAFDFTNQGIPNLGGSRDYIDTERLTEFWIRFNTNKAGKATIISENLARLK